ncbi:MAG: hypothetical protein LAT57_09370 [Balneolales bacterium]|nr:hypothetical protein [Balneolales bacterium]
MRKLTPSEKEVLSRLIHMESWDTLIEETGLQYGELRDDITNLISSRLIQVYSDHASGSGSQQTAFYDLDNLRDYSFRITGLGINTLTRH